jgi:hypothetical protein
MHANLTSTPEAPDFQQAAQSPEQYNPAAVLIKEAAIIRLRTMGRAFICRAVGLQFELIRSYCHQGDPEMCSQVSFVIEDQQRVRDVLRWKVMRRMGAPLTLFITHLNSRRRPGPDGVDGTRRKAQ